jgi:hypothetical protein
VSNIEQTIRQGFSHHNYVAKKESDAALLERLKKEFAKPRVVKSAREPHTVTNHPKMFNMGQFVRLVLSYPVRMKKTQLVPHVILAVPCPTCGVAAGKSCVLYSGELRTEAHANRKSAACEAIEIKRILPIESAV